MSPTKVHNKNGIVYLNLFKDRYKVILRINQQNAISDDELMPINAEGSSPVFIT